MEVERCDSPLTGNGYAVKRKAAVNGHDQPSAKQADIGSERWEKAEIMRVREKHIGPNVPVFFSDDPLHIVRGRGQYFYDEKGQQILDCINNVCHVGHCHPHVVKKAQEQIAELNTNSRYLHKEIVEYSERITSYLPESLSVCYFVCTGSEANDLASRLARAYTGGREIIAVDGAYHGHTQLLIDISSYKHNAPGADGPGEHAHVVPMPCMYRGPHRDPKTAGQLYAAEVKQAIDLMHEKGKKLSAFYCEGIMSCGGQIVLPPGYLKQVYKYVHDTGGVCVADEVQVGFGRVGAHFWAFEEQGVVPDIVTLGKPIGNGHPLALVVTRPEIAKAFAKTTSYFNTYGGNPVSCAIANAVLDVIELEKLQEHARVVGEHLLAGFRDLAKRHEIIGDIRGMGLMVGIDLVKDRESREPATDEAMTVITRMKNRHILLSRDGPADNVIKMKPPMCFSINDADNVIHNLDVVFGEIEAECERK